LRNLTSPAINGDAQFLLSGLDRFPLYAGLGEFQPASKDARDQFIGAARRT
jgi:hypothetical protein